MISWLKRRIGEALERASKDAILDQMTTAFHLHALRDGLKQYYPECPSCTGYGFLTVPGSDARSFGCVCPMCRGVGVLEKMPNARWPQNLLDAWARALRFREGYGHVAMTPDEDLDALAQGDQKFLGMDYKPTLIERSLAKQLLHERRARRAVRDTDR